MDFAIILSTAALATAGFTADAGPAVQVGIALRIPVISLGLELRGVLPSSVLAGGTAESAARAAAQLDVSQMTALLVPCLRWGYLFGCGVLQRGIVILDDGGSSQRSTTQFQSAYGPRAGLEVTAGRFGLFGFAEALFVPDGRGARYDPPVSVKSASSAKWRQPPVSGFFGLGLSVSFR